MKLLGPRTNMLLLTSLIHGAALAQSGLIELKLSAFKQSTVVNEKGEPEIVKTSVDKAIPGDIIIYQTDFKNVGKTPADKGALITNLIPKNTTYQINSSECNNCETRFSIDGKSFATADMLRIKDASGTLRLANPAEYSHIQWKLLGAVQPAHAGQVSYKAKINSFAETTRPAVQKP